MSPPAVVFLDVGGVVTPSPFPALAKVAKAYKMKPDVLKKKMQQYHLLWAKCERGQADPSEYLNFIRMKIGVDLAPWLHEIGHAPPNPQMLHVISLLRDRFPGIVIAAISNTVSRERSVNVNTSNDSKQNENVKKSKGANSFKDIWGRKLFDFVIESHIEGIRKGDGDAIFRLALRKLKDVNPSECLFLDDLKNNLVAPRKLGMQVQLAKTPLKAVKILLREFKLESHLIPNVKHPITALKLDRKVLQTYLEHNVKQWKKGRLVMHQFAFGQSNPTYHLISSSDATSSNKNERNLTNSFVLRKQPPGKLLPSAHDVVREYETMKYMGSQNIPVPEQILCCKDTNVIGTPFYIMRFVPGVVLTDAHLPTYNAGERTIIYENLFKVLAKIHSAPTPISNNKWIDRYVGRQLKRWGNFFEKSPNEKIPEAVELLAALRSHKFANEPPAKGFGGNVHGDFRLNNVIVNPDSKEIMAVLDWELSTVGDCLTDVVSALAAHFIPIGTKPSDGPLDWRDESSGIPSPKRLLEVYCNERNVSIDGERIRFSMAFQAFRLAAIVQGVLDRSKQGNASQGAEMVQMFVAALSPYCQSALDWLNGAEIPGLLPPASPGAAKL